LELHVYVVVLATQAGGNMITVSATELKKKRFDMLARVSAGEVIAVHRNGEKVALIVPSKKDDWRERMKIVPKFLVPPEQAFATMENEGEWETYL
jgi:prevent-host-death family protein